MSMINPSSFWLSVNNEPAAQIVTSERKARCAIACELAEKVDIHDYYVLHNGRVVQEDDDVSSMLLYYVVPRVLGGKGGFGSMLRALGAQIEKTTNREACRDLSGRRMRDVNNEKRLREWVANTGERDKAKEERRKERRERMKVPVHSYLDPEYDALMTRNREKLDEAMERGLKAKLEDEEEKTKGKGKGIKRKALGMHVHCKKARGWLGVDPDMDTDSDDSLSSSHSSLSAAEILTETGDNATTCGGDIKEAGSSATSCATTSSAGGSATQDAKDVAEDADGTPVVPLNGQQTDAPSLTLEECSSVEDLQTLGLDALKNYLMSRGLKCGGTLLERAQRVYSIKDLQSSDIPPSLLAKPAKKK